MDSREDSLGAVKVEMTRLEYVRWSLLYRYVELLAIVSIYLDWRIIRWALARGMRRLYAFHDGKVAYYDPEEHERFMTKTREHHTS